MQMQLNNEASERDYARDLRCYLTARGGDAPVGRQITDPLGTSSLAA
jgi:hypothetical protein